MAFPEWMGPNIESRHVEMMNWGTTLDHPLGTAPARAELGPGEENRYPKAYRYVGLVGGRQLVVRCEGSFDRAEALLSQFGKVERLMRIDLERQGGIWLDGGDCVLVEDNEPKRKVTRNPNGL